MKILLPGNGWPKFDPVKSRKEFTDGFLISNCENITCSDLRTHLIMNQLDVNCIITTKTSGCKWVQLKPGHHKLHAILPNLYKALSTGIKQSIPPKKRNDSDQIHDQISKVPELKKIDFTQDYKGTFFAPGDWRKK